MGAVFLFLIAEAASKKIGAVIRYMKFLSPMVSLSFTKSTIQLCMEYCCHVWAGAAGCWLEMSDRLQKRAYRTVRPSLSASFERFGHHWKVSSLSPFYRYYFGRRSSELDGMASHHYSRRRTTRCFDWF